jgi:hypothetical protein
MAADLLTPRISLATDGQGSNLRFRKSDLGSLEKLVFSRYPKREWGTFFRFGFRRTSWGGALSFVEALPPRAGEMDRQSPLTVFRDEYTRRAFHAAAGPLGVGVVHSHPEGCRTWPSRLDDDMDSYFAREFAAYSGGKPYCSLILQRNDSDGLTFSGRVHDRGRWLPLETLLVVGDSIERFESELSTGFSSHYNAGTGPSTSEATARLEAAFGTHSAARLRKATVGVVGCSGTGSPVVHVLARAGVGGFVLVDPDRLSTSNLERVHGAFWDDVQGGEPPLKVELMRRMIAAINPAARTRCFAGNILHDNVLDELLRCDIVLGCVDSYHGRATVSDFSRHYLLPALDVGVLMEGGDGRLASQLMEFTRYGPDDPCAFCRGRIDSTAMSFELMSEAELAERARQAEDAAARGADPDAYWRGRPRQLHTVGYLTTAAGALAAGYAEGWLTGAFSIPHASFQLDASKERLGVAAPPEDGVPGCSCGNHIGWGDPARGFRSIAIPTHWSRRAVIVSGS